MTKNIHLEKEKTMKKLLSLLCIAVLLVSTTACSDGRTSTVEQKLSREEAEKEMGVLLQKVKVHEGTSQMDVNADDDSASLAEQLPDISVHPLVVTGSGAVDVEIMSSPEKATRDSENDDWLIKVAEEFNAQNNGQSVSVRNVASGLMSDYVQSGKYIPAAVSASNDIWTPIMEQGSKLTQITPVLVPNTAGLLISNDVYKKLQEQYTDVNLNTNIEATLAGDIITSYTNPLVSSTGLNLLIAMMYNFDSANPASEGAIAKLSDFQSKIPSVAYTTAQMRESAKKGIIDSMVMEYQAYINEPELTKGYTFIPMGARHDSPLYATESATPEQVEVLNAFAEFAKQDKYVKLAEDKGFVQSDYQGETFDLNADQIREIQNIWKNKKDAGRPIVAVFVSDTSGSMLGPRLAELQDSLRGSIGAIKEDSYVGLVSYSSDVTVEVPIDKFNKQQKAKFNGAINNFSAEGGTATNDAILVAADLLLKKAEEVPNAKLMILVLSDGEQTDGYNLSKVDDVMIGLGIPINTIGYGETIQELQTISSFNEAFHTHADPETIKYSIRNIFNAEL